MHYASTALAKVNTLENLVTLYIFISSQSIETTVSAPLFPHSKPRNQVKKQPPPPPCSGCKYCRPFFALVYIIAAPVYTLYSANGKTPLPTPQTFLSSLFLFLSTGSTENCLRQRGIVQSDEVRQKSTKGKR